jgi:hypothetical protein
MEIQTWLMKLNPKASRRLRSAASCTHFQSRLILNLKGIEARERLCYETFEGSHPRCLKDESRNDHLGRTG